jgi:branched-chain amino acid transport system ATP-binding protein
MLKVKNVTKTFGKFMAIDNVSLEFGYDELVSIIGPNGAGKSTLYGLITGLIAPDKGEILFNGERIDRILPYQICRKGISLSFQISNLFNEFLAFENVRLSVVSRLRKYINPYKPIGKMADLNEEAEQCSKIANISNPRIPVKFLPHAGKKSIELAMALGTKPLLLLLDEPTAGMGAEEVAAIINVIKKVRDEKHITVVFTEHDLDIVFDIAPRVIVMNRGRIVKDGTPAEVKEDEEVRRIYGFGRNFNS